MAKFENKKDGLYIDDQKVLRAWESYSGWFWFATEKDEQEGVYFGFVQGLEEEWGSFDARELEALKPKVWELPKKALPYAGRRGD